jgi:nucleoside-diphosphate-sugar epimerase
LLFFFFTAITAANEDAYYFRPDDSVILITGAAGFLGSELSMALHRTYAPKLIICVDSMDARRHVGNEKKTEEELSKFEFQRQRVFHVMQTLGARGVFYRADFRPSIPEYFDVGQGTCLVKLVASSQQSSS